MINPDASEATVDRKRQEASSQPSEKTTVCRGGGWHWGALCVVRCPADFLDGAAATLHDPGPMASAWSRSDFCWLSLRA